MPVLDRRALLLGAAAAAAVAIAAPVAADRSWRASDYIDGLTALGFEMLAGPPGRWWEGEPHSITPAQRLQESALRAGLAAAPWHGQGVRDELVRRGLLA
ncbi:hypothetical protein [Inquilinus sp. CA228]|uniref:hypothetical protein n=1 Tax=Inquilinus sp. CA228 TaxID=3455609 RepID=UPI003F8D5595